MMAARLTDAKKKKIVADYAQVGSYAEVGRMNGVNDKTVKAVVKNNPEITRISEQKKAENTADMLSYMESRKLKAQSVIDECLDILPGKLGEASAAQVATVMGIVIDKFTRISNLQGASVTIVNDIPQILENMDALADIVRHPVPDRNIEDFE